MNKGRARLLQQLLALFAAVLMVEGALAQAVGFGKGNLVAQQLN